MQRLGIFSFYDADGIVDEYVPLLLNDLKLCLSRLIIVVNGRIDERGRDTLSNYSREIIVRSNKGFDAGAYKEVLTDYLGFDALQEYDEIVLLNDTFFGPFVSFSDIFKDMEKKSCDFWGITYADIAVLGCLQSYFLVFRRSIISDMSFYSYWLDNIDEKTEDITDVYVQFEVGLFYYLSVIMGRVFSSYVDGNICDIYLSPNYSMKKHHMPLLKRRTFKYMQDNFDNVMDALKYIMLHTDYPVQYIMENVNRVYNTDISEKKVREYKLNADKCVENSMDNPEVTAHELIRFIKASRGFYIYGTGIWAKKIYQLFCKGNYNFKGFLVSDLKMLKTDRVYNHPIYQFKSCNDLDGDIVLGVNKNNTIEIMETFREALVEERVFSLFPNTLNKQYHNIKGGY